MLDKEILNQYRNDAQGLARYFSEQYFKEHEKVFPINPFQVLTDLGIHFVFRNFDKMEGLFMPSTADMPIDLVAINAKRPITRQRFSAAHELCHFLKDTDTQSTFMCAISSNEYKEKYAESFAASFLIRACYIDVVFSLRVQAVDCQLKLGTHLNLVYKQVVRFAFLIMFFHIGV